MPCRCEVSGYFFLIQSIRNLKDGMKVSSFLFCFLEIFAILSQYNTDRFREPDCNEQVDSAHVAAGSPEYIVLIYHFSREFQIFLSSENKF